MKNKGLTVVIGLFIISLLAGSQVMAAYGVKGGVMMSKMDIGSDSTNGSWSVLGWRADAFYSLPLSPSISFKPGITFAMERAKYYETPGMQHERFSIFFIKTPLLMGFNLPGDQVQMFIGPYIAYRLGKEKYSNPDFKPFNVKNRFGLGMSLGLHFDLPIRFRGSLRSFIEFQVDVGITDFKRTEPLEVDEYTPGVYYKHGAYYKSQNISFLVGFTF
jgi:phosphate/sulfate permease